MGVSLGVSKQIEPEKISRLGVSKKILTDKALKAFVAQKAHGKKLSDGGGAPSVRMAQRLIAYSAMRIGNVVDADWREFHLDDEQSAWIIPRKKMKAPPAT